MTTSARARRSRPEAMTVQRRATLDGSWADDWAGSWEGDSELVTELSPRHCACCHCIRRALFSCSGVAARHPFGGPIFAVRHGVENQFHAARNSDLVEDAQQIFFDGVFAETEFTGDSAVGQAVGDERDNLFLARRQQRSSLGVNDPQGGHLGERVEYVVHLLIVDP